MTLDVSRPDPPALRSHPDPDTIEDDGPTEDDSLRRDELESVLEDGAWREGFEEWAAYTDLSEREFEVLRERGLFDAFGFAWDVSAEAIDYDVPPVPADIGDTATVSRMDAELDDLGRAVAAAMEAYLDEEEFGFFAEE